MRNRTIVGTMLAVLALMLTAFAVGPITANATVKTRAQVQSTIAPKPPTTATANYQCPKTNYVNSTFIWDCQGNWYVATPGSRTFRAGVVETYNESTRWLTTSLQSFISEDGRMKDILVYCQYVNGTTTAQKAHYIVGGAYADTMSFATGRAFCDGSVDTTGAVGYLLRVRGTYGSGTWDTILTFNNPSIGGIGMQYSHPERWCTC